MDHTKVTKEAIQVTKEIMVKFIESGRVSPANFAEIFPSIYATVLQTITAPSISLGNAGALEQERD